MKTPSNDGGAAFPVMYVSEGMTLRDYFAGQALAAVLVSPNFRYLIDSADEASTKDIVERAYWFADAMLDERMEEPK